MQLGDQFLQPPLLAAIGIKRHIDVYGYCAQLTFRFGNTRSTAGRFDQLADGRRCLGFCNGRRRRDHATDRIGIIDHRMEANHRYASSSQRRSVDVGI